MFQIDRFEFNNETFSRVQILRHNKIEVGLNWPVVYIINNDEEAQRKDLAGYKPYWNINHCKQKHPESWDI